MATTAIRPLGSRLFTDEASSLRSFRPNPISNTPSLKTSSLKSRKNLLPSLLGPRVATTNENLPQTMKSTSPKASSKAADATSPLSGSAGNNVPIAAKNGSLEADTNPLQRPRSKSRTILRMLTTKFTPRSSSSPSSPPPARANIRPPQVSSAYGSKESREAALRERGLLPPLKPNKDLSQQEQEQDRQLPIVPPTSNESATAVESSESAAALTAANLIKKEWEAKNRTSVDDQRERLNTFKFGASASSAPASPVSEQLTSSPPPPQISLQVATPVPSPELIPPVSAPARSSSMPSTPTRNKRSIPTPLDLKNKSLPPSPSVNLQESPSSPAFDPSQVALPASPLTPPARSRRSQDSHSPPLSPTSIPLPATPTSVRSRKSDRGTATPTHFNSRADASTPMPSTPVISLTPPLQSTVSVDSASEKSSLGATSRDRANSIPTQPSLSESASSIMTPSLDASSSRSMNLSSLGTAESGSSSIGGKGKAGGLKVKTLDHGSNIPMIVESPVEESFAPRLSDEPVGVGALGAIAEDDVLAVPRARPRGLTDPTYNSKSKVEKRKSLNPFKRGQALEAPDSENSPKRLSMSASLSNMRRSVVGSLSSRPKSTIETGAGSKMFDASHLPPSPTVPASFTERSSRSAPSLASGSASARSRSSSRPGATTGVGARPRQAVSPTLHSRGSILLETSNIEDEESRRMTELAFLG
ncbi:hypothetical protein BDQ12DRAFT_721665 [Crucibulum laeve]|uniref:Uncharacterized protein n=1 Tax=Crucibulum laeve TaxID=68775 RepID=A0A5C3M4K0_9AGAR|nr:hypothetical protein BDQ12DRAFT_721665 [Crucibulum laeve]